ncbi:uncharacterized protein PG998_007634 [Apiospora kogelbergensis]|uniref:MARVEL domain-containing protein n=1 Tax=Apiospora kogelbergensis TaxID=1337665 RepID=A0AAW0QGX2_9PEZI
MAIFDNLEWDADYVPGVKLGLHSMQILFGFVIFVLEIILFKDDKAAINGNNGWPFGLCFLSVLAWIYLVMTPRWERSRKLAQPHAMAVVDGVFAIFWLSAFASQAAYNTANSCGNQCKVSKAIVGIAFFEILFWIGTTIVSLYTVQYYNFNGNLPGYDKVGKRAQNIDPDKAAFSMAPHDEEAYAPVNMDDHDGDHLGPSHHTPYNADSYGSRPMFDSETEYRPHTSSTAAPQLDNPFADAGRLTPHNDPYASSYGGSDAGGPRLYAPPSVSDFDDVTRPAQFPAGNYDRTLH